MRHTGRRTTTPASSLLLFLCPVAVVECENMMSTVLSPANMRGCGGGLEMFGALAQASYVSCEHPRSYVR